MVLTIAGMIGSVVIITVEENYFSESSTSFSDQLMTKVGRSVIAVVGLGLLYRYFASYYSASARELKRIGE